MAGVDSAAAISNPAGINLCIAITTQKPRGGVIAQAGANFESRSSNRVSARLPVSREGVLRALRLAWRFADQAGLGAEAGDRLAIVVEEWVSNVVEHGGPPTEGRIVLSLERSAGAVRVTASDAGAPFDPRLAAFEGPNAERGGGVGLALIQAWTKVASYRRSAGRNRVVLEIPAG
jgi:anti-sigma regulatory factor (Ser/Thr protein kinase)